MRWPNLIAGCAVAALASFTFGQSMSDVTVAQSSSDDWNCFYAVTYNNSANSTKDVRLYKYTPSGSP